MKLKKIIFAITVLSIWIICIGGCEKPRNGDPIEIIVKNNTTMDTLIFAIQYNYPDTVLINYKEDYANVIARSALPNEESRFWAFSGWEWTLRNQCKVDGLVCIVYSWDTIRKYPFEQIQEDYNILERHVLSIEDLKEINWTIAYP